MLSQRAITLKAIADGLGRSGFAGKWTNAFGNVVVMPAGDGAFRLAIETRPVYGPGSDRRRQCKVSAEVKLPSGGWLTGAIFRTTPSRPESPRPNRPKRLRSEFAARVQHFASLPAMANGAAKRDRPANTCGRSPRTILPVGNPTRATRPTHPSWRRHWIAPAPRPRVTRRFAPIRIWPTTTGS